MKNGILDICFRNGFSSNKVYDVTTKTIEGKEEVRVKSRNRDALVQGKSSFRQLILQNSDITDRKRWD